MVVWPSYQFWPIVSPVYHLCHSLLLASTALILALARTFFCVTAIGFPQCHPQCFNVPSHIGLGWSTFSLLCTFLRQVLVSTYLALMKTLFDAIAGMWTTKQPSFEGRVRAPVMLAHAIDTLDRALPSRLVHYLWRWYFAFHVYFAAPSCVLFFCVLSFVLLFLLYSWTMLCTTSPRRLGHI